MGTDWAADPEDDDSGGLETNSLFQHRVDGPCIMLLGLLRNFIEKNRRVLSVVFHDGNEWDLTVSDLNRLADAAVMRMDAIQRESLALGALWKRHLDLLFLRDEVAQAGSGLRLVTDGEWHATPEDARGGLVREYELGPELQRAQFEATVAGQELEDKKSELAFRKNLEEDSRRDRLRRRRNALTMALNEAADETAQVELDSSQKGQEGPDEVQGSVSRVHNVRASADEAQGDGEGGTLAMCSICLEDLDEDRAMLPCGHCSFHGECVGSWLKKHPCCPHCKRGATLKDISRLVNASSTATGVPPQSRSSGHSGSSSSSNMEGVDVVDTECVRGDWGTKVNTLVADVVSIRRNGCGDKSVVFSSWADMLHVVSQALEANGISYEMCVTSKDFKVDGPMGRFKSNPTTSVLLLLMAKGAQGLTLTEANHVFLLHPIMNPQQEAQAVNRVRRIGQTKPTYVHKYLVTHTVEVDIYERQQREIAAAGGATALLAGAKKQKAGDQHSLTLDDFGTFFQVEQETNKEKEKEKEKEKGEVKKKQQEDEDEEE